jgi:hypothetical protein
MWFGSDSGLPTQSVLQGSWACDEELLRKLDVTEEDRHKILFDDARRFMSGKEDLGLC